MLRSTVRAVMAAMENPCRRILTGLSSLRNGVRRGELKMSSILGGKQAVDRKDLILIR